MADPCIYCGERANSEEHIFASQFIDLLSKDPRGFPLPTNMTLWDHTGAQRKIVGRMLRRKGRPPQPTVQFTTHQICTTCNNGWMDGIDRLVAPRLSLLIQGKTTLLSAADQESIATWLTNVAITARFAHIRPDHVEKAWTDYLYEHRRALPLWHVWIGRYVGVQPLRYDAGDIRMVATEPGTARPLPGGSVFFEHGVVATLIFGYFIAQIVGVDGHAEPGARTLEPIAKIWPNPRPGIVWPTSPRVIDDLTLPALIENLHGKKPVKPPS